MSSTVSKPRIFFVEGNIGTGKSTFLKMIEDMNDNDFQVIYEPLDLWLNFTDENGKNILQYFYEDSKRYAYTFQNIAFLSRVEKLSEIDMTKKYVFIERSIWSDRNIFAKNCYENGMISEIEYKLYCKWFDWLSENNDILKNLDYSFVYLHVSPEVSHERMNERNRKEENKISLEYLAQIAKKHDDWLLNETSNVKVVDARVNFREQEVFEEIFSDILKEIN